MTKNTENKQFIEDMVTQLSSKFDLSGVPLDKIEGLVEQLSSQDKFEDFQYISAQIDILKHTLGEESQTFEPIDIQEAREIKTPQDLEDVVADHNRWRDSVLNPRKKVEGGRAQLQHAQLSGFDLSDVNLAGADLSYADLSHSNLTDADLSLCKLTHANLDHANLKNTRLKRAQLTGTSLRHALIDQTNFADVETSEAIFDLDNLKKLSDQQDLL